jgi:hypothetical protein
MPDGEDVAGGPPDGRRSLMTAALFVWALVAVAALVVAAAGAAESLMWPLIFVSIVGAAALIRRYRVIGELALLALTIIVPALLLLFLTLGSDCGFCDDAASSVSNAPGP